MHKVQRDKSNQDKQMIEQLKEQILKTLEDPANLKRAAQIIEEMIHASPLIKK